MYPDKNAAQISEDFGAKWIPFKHHFRSPRVINQITKFQCQSACACQLLRTNHQIEYQVGEFHKSLLQLRNEGALTLPNVRDLLNHILASNYYRVAYPHGSVRDFFYMVLDQDKAWIASIRKSPAAGNGHTLVVCGRTRQQGIKVLDPWGAGPGSNLGSVGIITEQEFLQLWENSRCASLFSTVS